jgi:hypothetical protein
VGNPDQMRLLLSGAETWNLWREANPDVPIDLRGEDLTGVALGLDDQAAENGEPFRPGYSWSFIRGELIGYVCFHVNLADANLQGATILNATGCVLSNADLRGAKLEHARFQLANLAGANLSNAHLANANLNDVFLGGANLDGADLTNASLINSDLSRVSFIETTVTGCSFDYANVYGAAVWSAQGEPNSQKNLRISPPGEPLLTLDRIELAQFVYLLVQNRKLRDVISTLSSKTVLILGRFTEERKPILDMLSDEVRARDMLPITFDWEPSASRDLTETVQLLASICRFVVADITDARSVPQELSHIIPFFPSVPVQPLIWSSQRPYAMFDHWRRFTSVLPEFSYDSEDHLKESFEGHVLWPLQHWEQQGLKDSARNELLVNENQELRRELQKLRAASAP